MNIEDKVLALLEQLVQGQARLEQGQARLEQRQEKLEQAQARLEQRQLKLEQGQARLEQGQARLEQRQEKLEQRQEKLEQRQEKLEQRQLKLEQGQENLVDEVKGIKERIILMEDENKRRFGALFDGYDMLLKYAMKTNEDIAEIKARLENHEILLRWLENSTVKIAQSPVA